VDLHELTAAYALDALDADEAEAYEAHLAQCEPCRAELAALGEAATALAFATPAPAPPPRLRTAILDAAGAERANVVPLQRRPWAFRVAAAAAAVAACAAVGLGVWGASRGTSHTEALSAVVVLGADRHATLTVSGLKPAPQGKTYEAWVIPPGGHARPAGLFSGGSGTTVVHLLGVVPRGSTVAATVEHAGGASAPSNAPFIAATA
jgi:anti-sigma-K factor RskA